MTTLGSPNTKRKAALMEHFFPHYRGAILRTMIRDSAYHFLFVGDTQDPFKGDIKPFDELDPTRFVPAKCHRCSPVGGLTVQFGHVKVAMRRDVGALIFDGDARSLTTWLAAIIGRLLGKRVLFWGHGWLNDEKGLKNVIRCMFFRLAHGQLLYGNRAKQIGLHKGFMSENLYVVYNSLDIKWQMATRAKVTVEKIKEVRQSLFGHWNKPVVICSGRLVAVRGLNLLLDAVARLKTVGVDVDVLLVGDGPERATLADFAAAHGLSVRFYGACYDEERLSQLIMSANALVVPGRIGLTAMHSLIYGIPVITHGDPTDQFPEWEAITPGVSGDFFTKGDAQDLARTIRKWTGNVLPDESRRVACARIIEQYYNPDYQLKVIDAAVAGRSADMIG
jgi:1,2-diacylglycerol 3-alpha-glucosyltransferase